MDIVQELEKMQQCIKDFDVSKSDLLQGKQDAPRRASKDIK